MHRIIRHSLCSTILTSLNRSYYYKPKPDIQLQSNQLKHSLFNKKSFP
jgi:hypothetical protein